MPTLKELQMEYSKIEDRHSKVKLTKIENKYSTTPPPTHDEEEELAEAMEATYNLAEHVARERFKEPLQHTARRVRRKIQQD
ncbi:MAG: hypothetical protein ABSC50_00960 [Candidatus Bathyarchaeia archaeon]